MVRKFGLVNPGNPSKVPPTCLVFGDNHKYFISSAKNDLPPFLWGVLQCTEGRQPSVRQLLILLSMKTREVVSKNATFP